MCLTLPHGADISPRSGIEPAAGRTRRSAFLRPHAWPRQLLRDRNRYDVAARCRPNHARLLLHRQRGKGIKDPAPLVPAAEPLADRLVRCQSSTRQKQIANVIPEDAATLVRINGAAQVSLLRRRAATEQRAARSGSCRVLPRASDPARWPSVLAQRLAPSGAVLRRSPLGVWHELRRTLYRSEPGRKRSPLVDPRPEGAVVGQGARQACARRRSTHRAALGRWWQRRQLRARPVPRR